MIEATINWVFRRYVQPAVNWMKDQLEREDENLQLNVTYADSDCSEQGMLNTITTRNEQPNFIIGPVCRGPVKLAAMYGNFHNITVITPGANDFDLIASPETADSISEKFPVGL